MSDQDFDVIINSKDYQQFKQYKNKISLLQIELKQEKDKHQSKDIKINQLQKDNKFKQTEILFLVNLLKEAIHHEKKEKQLQFSMVGNDQKSYSFEILGESIMFNKQSQKQLQFKDNEFVKKYNELLVGMTSLSLKIQSQQELINKLNKMNSETNQLLINKSEKQLLNTLKDKLKMQLNSFQQILSIIDQSKLLKEKNLNLTREKTASQESNIKLKDEIKKLAQSLGAISQKLKKLENQNADLKKNSLKIEQEKKKKPQNNQAYFGKPYQIKLLIDEHIKQMAESLGKNEEFTKDQIKIMLTAQLKSLAEYIPKSLENNK